MTEPELLLFVERVRMAVGTVYGESAIGELGLGFGEKVVL